MKTKLIKGKVDILLVDGIPMGTKEIRITDCVKVADGKGCRLTIIRRTRDKLDSESVEEYLTNAVGKYTIMGLDGRWELFCKLGKIKYHQKYNLIDSEYNEMTDEDFCRNYMGHESDFGCGIPDSFQSLLEANGVLKENPHGKEKPFYPKQGSYEALYFDAPTIRALGEIYDKWKEAEANVFNPETTLIFIKQ